MTLHFADEREDSIDTLALGGQLALENRSTCTTG
jgi:hypothetical protein